MNLFKAIWRFLGSATLSVVVLLALVFVLCCGYYQFEAAKHVFEPLNRLLLWDWIISYGFGNLADTWWFFCFLLLLALLVTNTFVCTWQRVASLARRGAGDSRLDFVLRFSPHVMHLAFIIILVSHLVTYVFGLNVQNNVLLVGREITMPDSRVRLRLDSISSEFYEGDRLAFYRNRAIDQDIALSFIEPDGTVARKSLACNSPVWHDGYSIHLKNYYPKSKSSMPRRPYANVIIRRDPGVKTFFFGTAVFVVGLLGYLWQAVRQHRHRITRESKA